MSNQVEVNNNTIYVESQRVDEGLRSAEEEENLLKNKCGASFKIEEAGNEEQVGVGDEKVATSCFSAQCVHCTVGFPCSKKSPVVATGE